MNAEFVNVLVALVYMAAGTVGIALLMWWALKRFGSPGGTCKSKERDPQNNRGASIPRSDH